jgi:hypothetical protein
LLGHLYIHSKFIILGTFAMLIDCMQFHGTRPIEL